MTVRRIGDRFLTYPEEFPRENNKTKAEQVNNDDIMFTDYALNALQNLKSKMKALTIVGDNSNNIMGYLIF